MDEYLAGSKDGWTVDVMDQWMFESLDERLNEGTMDS